MQREASEPDADAVRRYYDEFAVERKRRDLETPNLRVERALQTILPLVHPDTRTLEIGCGIGLVTEQIAQRAASGFVWACDISERQVVEASARVTAANVAFQRRDVVRDFDAIRSWVDGPLDLIVMIDVLEHLPKRAHAALFHDLRQLVHDEAGVVLTFPSAQYQQYLRDSDANALQIIDEIIELRDVEKLASATGFTIERYVLQDVWLTNQYVHCVLRSSLPLRPIDQAEDVRRFLRRLAMVTDPGDTIILVDSAPWAGLPLPGRRTLPFLERGGTFWGTPADDATAAAELERMRNEGARVIAFTAATLWWFDYYREFCGRLRREVPRLLEDNDGVAFDLSALRGADADLP